MNCLNPLHDATRMVNHFRMDFLLKHGASKFVESPNNCNRSVVIALTEALWFVNLQELTPPRQC